MNPLALERNPWSGRRWLVTIGLLFLGQVFLLINFGRRNEPVPAPSRFPMRLRLAPGLGNPADAASGLGLPDPTLFALPHRQGFSGQAWLSYEPVDYRLASWTEPPRWFEYDETGLRTPMAAYVPTSAPPLLALQTQPPGNGWSVYVPPPAQPAESALEITGDLRQAENVPPLPGWPNADLLSNTVVRVLVQSDGSVFSAALLQESGLATADQQALHLSKQMQFSPALDEQGFRQVKLRYKWLTLPAQTNAPAPASLSLPNPP